MNYDDIKDQVKDGDLIAIKSTRSLLGKATVLTTGSPYTHTAIALRFRRGVWISEMNGAGNVLVPLSQYQDTAFDVFSCPVDRSAIKAAVLEQLRSKVGYGWAQCVYIGLHKMLGVALPADDGSECCSNYSVLGYRLVNPDWGRGLPTIAAPCDVVVELGSPIVRYTP